VETEGRYKEWTVYSVCVSCETLLTHLCDGIKMSVQKGRRVRLVKMFSPLSTGLDKWTAHRWKQQYVSYTSGWSFGGSDVLRVSGMSVMFMNLTSKAGR